MNKYLRALAANIIFFLLSTVFFLLITPISTRVMGEEFYGLWSIINAVINFLSIGSLGIDSIINKYLSESLAEKGSIYQNHVMTAGYVIVLLMAIIVSILLLLLRGFISTTINTSLVYKQQIYDAFIWISVGIIPQFLSRVPKGFLLSQLKNQKAGMIELLSTIMIWLGVVIIALYKKDLILISKWFFICSSFTFALFFMISKQPGVKFRFKLDLSIIRNMLNFSGWMFVETIAIALFQQFDRVLIGLMFNPSIVGVYSIGTSISLRLTMVTKQVAEVMLPYTSFNNSLGENKKVYETFRKLMNYVSLSLSILTSLLIIWCPEIFSFWISTQFSETYALHMRLLLLAYSLFSMAHPGRQTLLGIGNAKFVAKTYLPTSLLFLLNLFVLSKSFGFIGAVFANGTMIFLNIMNVYVYRIMDKKNAWKHAFSDMSIGIFVPIGVLLILLNLETKTVKILLSVVVIGILGYLFWKKFHLLIGKMLSFDFKRENAKQ